LTLALQMAVAPAAVGLDEPQNGRRFYLDG
jgi:hypothetical protein